MIVYRVYSGVQHPMIDINAVYSVESISVFFIMKLTMYDNVLNLTVITLSCSTTLKGC